MLEDRLTGLASRWTLFRLVVVLLLGAAIVPAQEEPASEPATSDLCLGYVIDEQGRPLEGVEVRSLNEWNWTVDDLAGDCDAVTDAAGSYALPRSDEGRRVLVFTRRGRATTKLSAYRSTDEFAPVCMRPGRTFLVRLVDAAGEPVEGVRVVARQRQLGRNGSGDVGTEVAGRSDAKGIVKMVGAALAGVELMVEESGWARTCSLPGAHEGLVELRTARTGFVRGHLVDGEGRRLAVSGQQVRVSDDAGNSDRLLTDAEGRFECARKSALPVRVTWLGARDPQNGTQHEGPTVEVAPGHDGDVEVVAELDRPAGASDTRAVLTVVDDTTGEPVVGAEVAWAAQEARFVMQVLAMGSRFSSVERKTDEKGEVALGDPDGTPGAAAATPVILAEGYAPWLEDSLSLPDAGEEPLRREIRLSPEAWIEGVVEDAVDGSPLAGAKVSVMPADLSFRGSSDPDRARWRATTDAAGRFRIGSMAAGEWELRAFASGRPLVEGLEVRSLVQRPVEPIVVKVPRGTRLVGRVSGLDALPPGLQVQVGVDPGDDVMLAIQVSQGVRSSDGRRAPLEADGQFVLDGLPEGTHSVTLVVPGLNLGEALSTVPLGSVKLEGEEVEHEFDGRLAVAGEVRGRLEIRGIELPPGRLAIVAERIASADAGRGVFTIVGGTVNGPHAYLDRDGAFVLRLPGGRYKLSVVDVLAGSPLILEDGFELAPGGEFEVERELEMGAVRLKLQDTPGRPGSHGAKLAFVAEPDGGGMTAAGGVVVLGSSLGMSGSQIDLAGRPAEMTVFLPSRTHSVELWAAREGPQQVTQVFRMGVGGGRGGAGGDASVEVLPRIGETLEVKIGLGAKDGR